MAREDEPRQDARGRDWTVRERFTDGALLEVELDTGRQHQIRVHLAHVGLPVLGDPVYGRPGRRAGRARGDRCCTRWRLSVRPPGDRRARWT